MFIFCARDLRPSSLFALGRAGEKQKFLSLLSASNFFRRSRNQLFVAPEAKIRPTVALATLNERVKHAP